MCENCKKKFKILEEKISNLREKTKIILAQISELAYELKQLEENIEDYKE